MQVVIDGLQFDQKIIQLEHLGETLNFKSGAWPVFKRPELIFGEINKYWAELPMNTQNKIWGVYKEISNAFEQVRYVARLHEQIRALIGKLMDLMPFEQMLYHTKRKSNIKYPLDLRNDYGNGAPQGALTYLKDEYIELVALLLMMRPLVPILGQYITNVKDDIGNNHKEYQAGILLLQSKVIEAAPYKRLQLYMHTYIGDLPPMLAANLGGITTANFPNWLFYTTLVKKLAALELVNTTLDEEPTNIMSKVYNHIKAAMDQPERLIQGKLIDKSTSAAESGADDDNTSRIEGVKVREPVSEGSRVAIEHSLEKVVELAQKIDYTIPKELILTCYDHLVQDSTFQPNEYKFWLTQWVICGIRVMNGPSGKYRSSICSAKALTIMRYQAQIAAFAAAQAILWHHKFYNLALLISDVGIPIPSGVMLGAGVLKLEKQHIDALTYLYPMSPVPKTKKQDRVEAWPNPNPEALTKQAMANCIAIKEIDNFVKVISTMSWAKKGPQELTANCALQFKGEFNLISADIKKELAEFIIASKTI